ncbi:MAG: hypothetical protein JJE49_03965 [Peptostreptococcaceae bacterium]|nr:hypothetical protein [Peptostreptococcaceae bacterium]
MLTIEKNLVSELIESDIKTLREINQGLVYYKSYYLSLTWFNSGLQYSEYFTLMTDFYCFYHEIKHNENKVELCTLNSFVRSFKLLLKKIDEIDENLVSMLRSFLIASTASMAVILDSLLEGEN